MTRVLFIFLDGVGLGEDDPEVNPFARASMPAIEGILDGRRLLADVPPLETKKATFLGVDARLGLDGHPQSASGQATLLTGINVPAEIDGHYGPKPNPPIAEILRTDNLFMQIHKRGANAALLNAYPPRYFDAVNSGHRLYSAIPLAVTAAGLDLMTSDDLNAGRALSVDFTGKGWAEQPGFPPAPIYTPGEAGNLLADLSQGYDLAWFDFWPSDYTGHRGTMEQAVKLLESLDAVFDGLLRSWENRQDLIVVTSDHGNMEDLSHRGHTDNPVPALLIGPSHLRRNFAKSLVDLTNFAPAVLRTIFGDES